ncbi:MAG: hypothetical protein LBF81_06280 [Prevotellaceae bacterium]|jgi:uncharacterized protein (TIGR02145 family)|nr:hypothetical protein [Prevotellaceae bacterium]
MKKIFIFTTLLLLLACENREEPVQFKLEAEQAYAFPETATTASFAITSNIPWQATLTNGGDWCRITPTTAKGDGKVEITVTANTAYLQERTASIVVKAGTFNEEITVTQAPPPCPAFDAGSIAATGQTIFIGETPETIHSVQEANGGGAISYQWYKNDDPISGATAASYTPPPADAAAVGAHTYTRRAKDNTCNTTLAPATGKWVLNITACSAGTIASSGQTVALGGTPETINSLQGATGSGTIVYQWYKNGSHINGATAANYTPPPADANTVGAYTYTRRAKDNTCNTTLTQSAGSWVLTVTCGFAAGAIDSTGQTIVVGGAPVTINSAQDATGGGGAISYQWYKNGNPISDATAASYTPPQADANTVGAHTYTRRAKDDACNTILTPAAGNWVLTVTCASFNAGAIDNSGQTVTIGGTPVTINSAQDATGGGVISYQWYKNGNPISDAIAASYTPPPADANTVGAHTYTRRAKDNTCNTTLTQSAGSWVLTVLCGFNAGAIDSTGQIIIIGGTPATINSAQDAAGGAGAISYQWYKDGVEISGATAANYTPPPADAATLGAYTYTRRAKDNTCNTALTPAAGSWVLTVATCVFNAGAIASTGQTLAVGGTPAAINSTQNAAGGDGIISYRWYKNGNLISGATATSYTPPPADANMAGTHTYTRRAKDNTCQTAFTQSAGSWVLAVYCPAFDAGAIATDGQTVCSGNMVTAIASNTDASGGNGNITYQWRRNGTAINSTNAATYNPVAYGTTAGTHTFTRWARDGSCNTAWTQSAGSWVLAVTASAELTLATANSTQYVANGATIAPIKYTTVNASSVTVTGLPAGVTYDWASNTLTISGSSTVTGTHAFVVTATGISGCTNKYASGSIRVYPEGIDGYGCVISNITLGTVGFASTVTHVVSGAYGSQTWSAPVTATYCDKETLDGHAPDDTYRADCRNNTDPAFGHLFTWCLVVQYANEICPHPWRVPVKSDYEVLNSNMVALYGNNEFAYYISAWGAVKNGYSSGSTLVAQTSFMIFQSATPTKSDFKLAYDLRSCEGSCTYVYIGASAKNDGHGLRCIKDE